MSREEVISYLDGTSCVRTDVSRGIFHGFTEYKKANRKVNVFQRTMSLHITVRGVTHNDGGLDFDLKKVKEFINE